MATDRPRVQGYLDPEVYKHLGKFQVDRNLKESPALNQILREYFGLELCNQASASPLQIEEFIQKSLQEKFKDFDSLQAEFKNEVWLQLKKQFDIWNETLNQAVSNDKLQRLVEGAVVAYWSHSITDFNSRLEALEAAVKPIEGLAEISHSSSESPSELPRELNLSQLARHLGISKSVISRRKTEPDFEEWSRGKDPSGIAWRYDRSAQKFSPARNS